MTSAASVIARLLRAADAGGALARRQQVAPDQGADGGADQRGKDEEPELAERPVLRKYRSCDRAGGIDRGIGHGDADEVHDREAETDGERGKAGWRGLAGRAEDDQQERGGE